MDPYIPVLAGFGLLVLLTAWVPMVLREAPLSLPIVCVGLGALLWSLPDLPGPAPDPREHAYLTERLTEFVVVISLMGAGLKIDRPFDWRAWRITWRLLGIAMPFTIAALTLMGHLLLGLGFATALLLAAALAPTDPVLASDIQVGPPLEGKEDETRFALTSEAGLNDGLAFPFVLLALALATSAASGEPWLVKWLSYAVVWKIVAGVAIGAALGFSLGWLVFHMPNRSKLSRTGDGFVALGITALVYGVTEMASAYGFLAVFVAAISLRAAERGSDYHEKLHGFAEELERLLMMALLVLFGGALARGGLLGSLDVWVVSFVALALLVVRPLSGWLSLAGASCPPGERAVIAVYGIRGIGSFYYLAYGLGHGAKGEGNLFENPDLLWTTMSLTVLVSILIHGMTVTPVMTYLDRQTGRSAEQLELSLEGGGASAPSLAGARSEARPDGR